LISYNNIRALQSKFNRNTFITLGGEIKESRRTRYGDFSFFSLTVRSGGQDVFRLMNDSRYAELYRLSRKLPHSIHNDENRRTLPLYADD